MTVPSVAVTPMMQVLWLLHGCSSLGYCSRGLGASLAAPLVAVTTIVLLLRLLLPWLLIPRCSPCCRSRGCCSRLGLPLTGASGWLRLLLIPLLYCWPEAAAPMTAALIAAAPAANAPTAAAPRMLLSLLLLAWLLLPWPVLPLLCLCTKFIFVLCAF